MDATDKAQAVAALRQLGTLNGQGEVISGPLAWDHPGREPGGPQAHCCVITGCPYYKVTTHLRRHEGGNGVATVLLDGKWQEG